MSDDTPQQPTDDALGALDTLIRSGRWDESNFLKVIGKKLNQCRHDFLQEVGGVHHQQPMMFSHLANRVALRSGQQEVFVALYASDGSNLKAWERIIANLPKQIVSRPVYADEDQVNTMIKTKERKDNEAYVAIYIHRSDLLSVSADKVPHDKLGQALLVLKDDAIHLDRLLFFYHSSGRYDYVEGRLIKAAVNDSVE